MPSIISPIIPNLIRTLIIIRATIPAILRAPIPAMTTAIIPVIKPLVIRAHICHPEREQGRHAVQLQSSTDPTRPHRPRRSPQSYLLPWSTSRHPHGRGRTMTRNNSLAWRPDWVNGQRNSSCPQGNRHAGKHHTHMDVARLFSSGWCRGPD